MEENFGENYFAFLVDEGGAFHFSSVLSYKVCDSYFIGGYSKQYDGVFAVPAIGEKGYLDVRVDVSSPGGHSSIPPAHTVRNSI